MPPSGKKQNKKKFKFPFNDKRWGILVLGITIFFAFFIQSVLDAKFNPDTVQANMLTNHSSAREAYKISDLYNVINTEKDNHYIAPGEEEVNVYSFAIQTFSEPLVLNELRLNLKGDLKNDDIEKVQLFENESVIAKTYSLKDGKIDFKNFTSVLQANSYKEYIVKMDISDNATSGARFKFEISGPYDILIKKDDSPVYSLDTYPFSGSYVTVLGWRK